MALSQIQIIQSLGESLSWFERELSWGVKEGELRHLTGRIGELYAAMITRGQMAPETNQRGYDVISADNERISVKTVTSSNHAAFNETTIELVDRIIILKLNVDADNGVSIECLMDLPIDKAKSQLNDNLRFYISNVNRSSKPIENIDISSTATFDNYEIRQYENGTIHIVSDNEIMSPARPILRDIAVKIGVDINFETGAEKNTRHLGAQVIKRVNHINAAGFPPARE